MDSRLLADLREENLFLYSGPRRLPRSVVLVKPRMNDIVNFVIGAPNTRAYPSISLYFKYDSYG